MYGPIMWSGYGRKLRPPIETLTFPMLHFDLVREIERLRAEETYTDVERNGKTLVKHRDLRVVLTVLGAGHHVPRHRLHGAASVQVLEGRLRIRLSKRTLEVDAGQMLAIEHDVPFDIESETDSAYLMTFTMHEPKAR